MISKLKNLFPSFLSSVVNSYTQIFFSNNKIFAGILMVVTFFDFFAGLSGIIAVMLTNIVAYLIGFNRDSIRKGYYGFNSLLVGLGLGVYYQISPEFLILLLFASLLTLFLTLMMEGVIGKYGLPFLSLSFLLGIWLVTLASRQFTALKVSESGIYMMNDMYDLGGQRMVDAYSWFNNLVLPDSIRLYFRSLGAIFFQYHLFAGIFVAIGLLIYSRISFILSLLGFFSAYAYYLFIGADIHELSYGYIGFNFILTAIAVGGFFIIPSRWSFLWVILLTPLISIVLTSSFAIFSIFQLSVFSLPFNIVVILFLYSLKFRERFFTKPELVGYQQFSPEKNLYSHLNYKSRFGKSLYLPLSLPFWGEWKVTQGHGGSFTHKGDWRHAWDFEIVDEEGLTYTGDGNLREDYYCYNKPVLAPADGLVAEITDEVAENEIGSVDLEHNWGNSIVLHHTDQLYSKLSHLKQGSFKVAPGDPVKKGQIIALCGNSGRSPYPHIHFQLQATPFIGSKTIDYPIGHYIRHKNGRFDLISFETPENNIKVSNINKNNSLEKAFHFIPGQRLRYQIIPAGGKGYLLNWEVQVDPLNNTFLYCERSNSRAYFRNDGDIHYFTYFTGDKSSMLFYFFLGGYKILTGYYKNLQVKDLYPIHLFNHPLLVLVQDFVAPFWLFTKSEYNLRYLGMDDELMQTNIHLKSKTSVKIAKRDTKVIEFELFVTNLGLEYFVVLEKNRKIEAKLIV